MITKEKVRWIFSHSFSRKSADTFYILILQEVVKLYSGTKEMGEKILLVDAIYEEFITAKIQ